MAFEGVQKGTLGVALRGAYRFEATDKGRH